jgi:hypothetical protein
MGAPSNETLFNVMVTDHHNPRRGFPHPLESGATGSIILNTAFSRRLTHMNHAMDAPRPFTFLADWQIQAVHRISAFICG